ncbi:MAG TPA: hypothetical protein VEQ59_07315 [Polyangiaceae bacterium]|nr:hypothetical protein [Polyangiaceae bacterium]
MKSGHPPSSHAFARGAGALELERGKLRESLGGLRNLAQLLHSLRVGSRPLSNALPAARDACDPLRHAMTAILALAREAFGDDAASASLDAYVSPRIHELETALTEAAERPLSVKLRLSLEERVTRLSQELDTARGLFELLSDSIAQRPVCLDLLELSRQSFSGPPSGGSWPRETLIATLVSSESGLEVEVDPRAMTSLIAWGVELVASPADASQIPQIRVSPHGDGCRIVIERGAPTAGEDLMLRRRGVIVPTLPCVMAAAHANGAQLELDQGASRFSLTFGNALPGRKTGEVG